MNRSGSSNTRRVTVGRRIAEDDPLPGAHGLAPRGRRRRGRPDESLIGRVQSHELLDGVGDQLRVGPELALERAVGGEALHDGGNRERGGYVPGD
jgi:hypothetical protein